MFTPVYLIERMGAIESVHGRYFTPETFAGMKIFCHPLSVSTSQQILLWCNVHLPAQDSIALPHRAK